MKPKRFCYVKLKIEIDIVRYNQLLKTKHEKFKFLFLKHLKTIIYQIAPCSN